MSFDSNLMVDGLNLRLEEFSCSVSFSTSTDALFASFILKYQTIPLQVFDDLLSILHLDGFNNKELTFNKSLDVYLDIADRRREMAVRREHPLVPPITVSGVGQRVPKLVVELATDHLEQERASCMDMQLSQSLSRLPFTYNVDNLLRKMALVHRSWTGVAQQKLRKSIHVLPTDKNLRLRLLDPHIGPWVQEVWFGGYSFSGWGTAEGNNEDERMLLRVILQRCPNIRFLLFGTCSWNSNGTSQGMSSGAMHQLRTLSSLEHVWIYRGVSEQDLSELCTSVIPELHSLKGLYLSDYRCWVDSQQTSSQSPGHLLGSPSASLQRLSLSTHSESNSSWLSASWLSACSKYLSWLFIPRDGYNPKELELNASDVLHPLGDVARFIEVLVPLMPSIESLHLRHYNGHTSMTNVLERFTSLRRIRLYVDHNLSETPLALPNTIHEFHIQFMAVYGYYPGGSSWTNAVQHYSVQDTCIASQLQKLSSLEKVSISIASFSDVTDTSSCALSRALFPATTALCAAKFIGFVVETY